jgi:hypothetical protein
MSQWQELYKSAPTASQRDIRNTVDVPRVAVNLLRIAMRACLAANIGMFAVVVWSAGIYNHRFHIYQLAVLNEVVRPELDASDRAAAVARGAVLPLLLLVLFTFALWAWAADGVAAKLRPQMRGSRAWAFFGWFIPLVALVTGSVVLTRIWRTTNRGAVMHDESPPLLVYLWAIGLFVALGFASRLALYATYWPRGDEADISHGADLAATGYWILAAVPVMNIALVIVISRRLLQVSKPA